MSMGVVCDHRSVGGPSLFAWLGLSFFMVLKIELSSKPIYFETHLFRVLVNPALLHNCFRF